MKKITLLVLALPCLFLSAFGQKNFTQTVRGTVADKSLQSGLPGAVVILLNSNPVIAFPTDENGKFKLLNVPVGRQSFQIRMMGYKDVFINNLEVLSGKENVISVSMEEDLKQVSEVLVQGEKNKLLANNNLAVVSAINMRSAEINRYAGSRSDPSQMASNFAGVATGADQRNDIIVRGNSPWGVLWKMEGVDIPNPNHFALAGNTGGAFSILNNNLLANSDFLTGAFPAEYGNKTAAVFDVKLRKGNNEKRENTFQIGLNGLEFVTEGPLSKAGKGSYLASGRALSFKALDALGVSIGASGIPQYQDGTFKLHLPTGKEGQLSFWGMAGRSSIILNNEKEDMEESYQISRKQDIGSGMYAFGLSHTHHFGEKTMGIVTISASGSTANILSKEKWTDKPDEKSYNQGTKDGQVIGQYVFTHKWNPRNMLKTGLTYRNIYFNNKEHYFDRELDLEVVRLDQKGNSGLFQTYAQWQHRVNEKLTINPGIYFQHFGLSKSASLEPRISATYQASDKDRFSMAGGMHSQTSPLHVYQFRFRDEATGNYNQPNQNLGFSKSLQAVAGYNRSLGNSLNLKAEAYFQHLYNVPVSLSQDTGASTFSILNTGADWGFGAPDSAANKGTGSNYGLELSLEKGLSHGFYFLSNLSLFKSTYKGADGISRSTAFDFGHVANLLAGKEFYLDKDHNRLISVDVKLTHSGGRHYIPVDAEASKRDNKTRYDFANAYKPKLKDYFRTDFKVTYQVNRPKANHNFFIAADNVMNTQNILAQEWNNKKKMVQTYYQLGLFPYLGYRVQF